MKERINNISVYFLRYNWWVFGVLILFVSYVWMQKSTLLGWPNYGRLIAGLSSVYILPLAFAVVREWPNPRWLSKHYRWWWILLFGVPPAVLAYLGTEVNDLPFSLALLNPEDEINRWGVPLVGVLLIMVDGFLWLARRKRHDRLQAHWITRLSVPALAIIVVGLFALFMVVANNFVPAKAAQYHGLAYFGFYLLLWVEVTFIYLSYYLIYYLHHHFLYRRLLQEKGFLHYLAGAVAMILLLSPIYAQLIYWLPMVTSLRLHTVGLVPNVFATINYIIPLSVFVLSFPFIILQEWYQKQQTISELEKEKKATELDLLKQQINPHFFFNTLNNLYAMSLTQDDKTPETILKLSELMRYVIYQGQQAQVPLAAEINYLKDYLDLQQIRLHQAVNISFQHQGHQDDTMVAPLLFIILLENAFKHGVEPAEGPSFLEIKLTQEGGILTFYCRNSLDENGNKPATLGIGLQNLRRRLAFLYPNRHQLDLKITDRDYIATLKLEL